MRPPEFTGGNQRIGCGGDRILVAASMRPPEFTGGNGPRRPSRQPAVSPGFNEAAGIHRRKRKSSRIEDSPQDRASMRPPEFTGGNQSNASSALAASRSLQ